VDWWVRADLFKNNARQMAEQNGLEDGYNGDDPRGCLTKKPLSPTREKMKMRSFGMVSLSLRKFASFS